jgi:hypothetical protein
MHDDICIEAAPITMLHSQKERCNINGLAFLNLMVFYVIRFAINQDEKNSKMPMRQAYHFLPWNAMLDMQVQEVEVMVRLQIEVKFKAT